MTICFLTQYFYPDVGAPQARLYELAVRLGALGRQVTVLMAMPFYPEGRIQSGGPIVEIPMTLVRAFGSRVPQAVRWMLGEFRFTPFGQLVEKSAVVEDSARRRQEESGKHA